MKTQYYLVGKVAMASAVGELPRIGEIVVLVPQSKEDKSTRFRVIDVQHMVQKMAGDYYTESRIEVHIELID